MTRIGVKRVGRRILPFVQRTQVACHRVHHVQPRANDRRIVFHVAYTDLRAEFEIADGEHECFRQRQPLMAVKSLVALAFDVIQQNQRLVQWARADRVCQQQFCAIRG